MFISRTDFKLSMKSNLLLSKYLKMNSDKHYNNYKNFQQKSLKTCLSDNMRKRNRKYELFFLNSFIFFKFERSFFSTFMVNFYIF